MISGYVHLLSQMLITGQPVDKILFLFDSTLLFSAPLSWGLCLKISNSDNLIGRAKLPDSWPAAYIKAMFCVSDLFDMREKKSRRVTASMPERKEKKLKHQQQKKMSQWCSWWMFWWTDDERRVYCTSATMRSISIMETKSEKSTNN